MKKIATIWITVFLLAGLATSAFAFGPGWGGHERYDHRQGYAHGWQDNGRGNGRGGHDRDNRHEQRVYGQPSGYHAFSYGPGGQCCASPCSTARVQLMASRYKHQHSLVEPAGQPGIEAERASLRCRHER